MEKVDLFTETKEIERVLRPGLFIDSGENELLSAAARMLPVKAKGGCWF